MRMVFAILICYDFFNTEKKSTQKGKNFPPFLSQT
jgi:hypothetical protein